MDRSGTEYACVQGWGFGDGPYDLASVEAIRSWNVTAVRVPLNEDCWLGINGVTPAYSGAPYRAFIAAYVHLLESQAIRPILDLHWNAPGTNLSTGQMPMADEDHAPAFWASVASTFRNDSLVIFDLYNEPYGISWNCWENGCFQTFTNPGWQTAGFQQLLNVVRSAGATSQLVLLGGLNWSNDDSGWLAHEPTDPAGPGHLGVSLHMYNFNTCSSWTCWNQTLLPIVQAGLPLVTGELGESDCNATFIDRYFGWADPLHVSYLGWTWDDWSSCTGPTLIANYTGAPYQAYGTGFRDHLLGFAVPPPAAPGAPFGVQALPGNASVRLSWSYPASNGSWPTEGYNVSWGTSATPSTVAYVAAGGPLALTVSSLANGVTYDFALQAVNEVGTGPWSSPVTAVPRSNVSAQVSASPLSGPPPLEVVYRSSISGGVAPYSELWSFGDGGTASGGPVVYHNFTAPGTFVARDQVCAQGGECVNATAPSVSVGALPVVAQAKATPLRGSGPLTVSLQGSATGGTSPYAYLWRFGDGGSGAGADPTHVFRLASGSATSPGTFVVRLWVNDSAHGSNETSLVVTVDPPIVLSIAASPISGSQPLHVTFWANASGGYGGLWFNWSLGDGTTSTGTPVTHTYSAAGTYPVTVRVGDLYGDATVGSTNISVLSLCSCPSSPPSIHPWEGPFLFPAIAIGGALLLAAAVFLVLRHRRGGSPPLAPPDGAPPAPTWPDAGGPQDPEGGALLPSAPGTDQGG